MSSTTTPHTVYLSLGTNIGNRVQNLLCAIKMIQSRIGTIESLSDFIITEPWGFDSQNTFMNAAVGISTTLGPMPLLRATQQIETDMGRTQKSTDGTYHDRIIDIDILLFDDLHIDTPQLTVPHPLMKQREFVIRPLAQILPTISEL